MKIEFWTGGGMTERELFAALGVDWRKTKTRISRMNTDGAVNKLVKTEKELWIALGVREDTIAEEFCAGPGVRGPRINARANGHRMAGVDPANGVYSTKTA